MMDGDGMDGDFGSMNISDDVSIPIIPLMAPAYEGSRVSDSGLHAADSGAYSFSTSRPSNGTATVIRRRNSEPNPNKSRATKNSTYYPKFKAIQVQESRSEIADNPRPDHETDDASRNSLHEKIEAMESGVLLSEADKLDNDDSESSDEKDDGDDVRDTEEMEKNGGVGDVENNKKPRKCSKWKVFDVSTQFLIFSLSLILLIACLYNRRLKNRSILGSEIWRWCALILVMVFGRWMTRIANACIVLLIETKFLFNEKVVYYVHGVKKSVRFAVWVALVLVAWLLLIDTDAENRFVDYITRTLISALIGAVLWMFKTVLVKLIAAKFHVNSFFAKIREAISDEYVLWTLSVPRSIEVNKMEAEAKRKVGIFGQKKKDQRIHHEASFTLKKLGRMKPGKMPASTMGQLINRVRSSKLSFVSDPNLNEQKNITTRSEAERAASDIFKNVATNKEHPEYITKDDLLYFENKQNIDCLNEWFFKLAEEGKISEIVLSEWMVNVYKQREYLAHSLKDSKTAIEELSRIFSVLLSFVIFFVWLFVMRIATTKLLLLFSSQILLLGFIFGNSCKTLFDCMIFVFVSHPFDIGDRCVVDGVQMIVEEMDILKTAFLRYDNEMIYYPNVVLSTKPISNFNRSPERMGDSVLFDIDVSTPVAKIEALKAKIKLFVEEEKSHHWYPEHSVQVREIENMNKMKMALYVTHRMKFQDFGEKTNRRTELIMALKLMFEQIGLEYHLPPQPQQQVHISGGFTTPPPASSAYMRRAMH